MRCHKSRKKICICILFYKNEINQATYVTRRAASDERKKCDGVHRKGEVIDGIENEGAAARIGEGKKGERGSIGAKVSQDGLQK